MRNLIPGLAAAAVVLAAVSLSGCVLHLKREISRAVREIALFRTSRRNVRLRTGTGLLAELWSGMNGVLEETQRLETERELTKRRMKELLSGVSHDIRTPLTSIIGYLEALRDGVAGTSEEEREFLAAALDKAENIRSYTESVFRLARLEAGGGQPVMEELDLAELLRRAALSFVPNLEGSDFTVRIDIPETPCRIRGEPASLLRIFQNLIGNATRHGAEGRYLGVGLTRNPDGSYRAEVEDRGKGLTTEEIGRILAPDAPASPPLSGALAPDTRGSGTPAGHAESAESPDRPARSAGPVLTGSGLGLRITRKLVERHGGTFGITSVPFERTVFTVTFPPADRPVRSETAPQ